MSKQQRNAGDEVEVKSASERDDLRTMRDADDMRKLLCEEWGRRIAWKILCDCGIFKSSFVTNAGIYFNEGMRNVGLILLSQINDIQPEAYAQMVKEAREDKLA